MPSRGQSVVLTYIAWDTNANVGKTGDVANHTLRWIKDGTSSAPTNSPSEIDATNAPGAYKLTMTTAECTCDTGTLAGKSSTANVSIVPVSITFEQLPTVAAGATNGLPLVDSSGRVKSNLEAIDGLATNGNNATLKLKSLDIQSDSYLVNALNIVGGYNGGGVGSGGTAVKIVGGNGPAHGYGLHITASPSGSGTAPAVYLDGGVGGCYGLQISGYSVPAILLTRGTFGTDVIECLTASGVGSILANLSGSIGSVDSVRPKKNIGLDNFMFPMFDATTKVPKAGLTVTAERAIDGNPFSPCSNSVVELSNGVYRVSLSSDDMNGEKIMLRFSATGADDQLIEIITQD